MQEYIWQLPNWTDFTWKSDKLLVLLGNARRAQGSLLAMIQTLGLEERKHAYQELLLEEAIQTARIEGELYKRNSVRSSIAKQLGLPTGHTHKTEPHIDGLIQAILNATQNYDQPLTKERLFSWHAALFPTGYSGLHKIEVGAWRSNDVAVVSGAVGREKVHYQAPPPQKLEKEMNQFIQWWHTPSDLDGLLRAALAHFWFVMIHPFDDGNGRIARVLTDMALSQDESLPTRYYSLSSQIVDERSKYYAILKQCQGPNRDVTPWLEWFLDTFIQSLEKSQQIVSVVFDKAAFWREHVGVTVNKKQQKVLNKMLDAGKNGFTGSLTTRKYAAITKTSTATAFRDIDDLVHKGLLTKNKAKGRSVSYDIAWVDRPPL